MKSCSMKPTPRGIPVFGSEIEQVTLGCVAAEGLDYVALGMQTGRMAARVLKGEAEASDIPYETIEEESALYVNTAACEALGVTIPEDLMARATDMADKNQSALPQGAAFQTVEAAPGLRRFFDALRKRRFRRRGVARAGAVSPHCEWRRTRCGRLQPRAQTRRKDEAPC